MANPSFQNCDVWGNSGGNSLCGTDLGGNIYSDPMFCDIQTGNYYLHANSPCVGAGIGGVNIGALGIGCGNYRTWYVSTSGNDTTGDGSQSNPFRTIQKGISKALGGDTVLVAPGTYNESLGSDSSIVLASQFLLTGDSNFIDSTIVQGSGAGWGIQLCGLDSTSQVTGFTWSGWGGAIRCYGNCAATISHNKITNNGDGVATTGGFLIESGAHPKITQNLITNNLGLKAGAIECDPGSGSALIENNLITGNIGIYAGAIYSGGPVL